MNSILKGVSSNHFTGLNLDALILSLLVPAIGWASGVVTIADDAHLRAALVGGGTVSFAVNGKITLTNTLLITNNTSLNANGHSVVISGGNNLRLFQVNPGCSFVAEGLTLADGSVVGASGQMWPTVVPPQDGFGGAILNYTSIVTLVGCTLSNNFAKGGDGNPNPNGYYQSQDAANGYGGALCSFGGELNLSNCSAINNTAQGGLGSPPDWGNAVGNSGHGWGGAVYSSGGAVSFSTVTLGTNSVKGGKAQFVDWGGAQGQGAGGGAYLTNSIISASNSTFAGNIANAGAGPGGAPAPALGGALCLIGTSKGSLCLCRFVANNSNGGSGFTGGLGQGGAVFAANSLIVSNSTFSYNVTSGGNAYLATNQGPA